MKKLNKTITILAVCLLGFGVVSTAMAQSDENGNRRQGPPEEAFEACVGLVVDDACTFTSPRGEVNGQCVTPPRSDDQELVCMPEGMGQDGNRPPPPAK